VTGYAGLATCVHCGFCLQSCPTYVATGDEADSPRGRIILMRRLESGELSADDPRLRHHLDRCLGCRACEPVCPSGVSYGPALEAARAEITERHAPPLIVRALLHVIARPALRRLVFGLARLARPAASLAGGWSRAGFAAAMLAASRARRPHPADQSTAAPAADPPPVRAAVTVFEGCIQHDLFGHVNGAAVRVLTVNGYAPRSLAEQGCCGALHAHAGDLEGARTLARANIRAFADHRDALVAATAAGCGAMLRAYGALLADDPLADVARDFAARVRDVTELLAEAGPLPGAPLAITVAYDAPCHLVHAQRVADPPLTVLAAVPGLAVTPHEERDACCGSAGLYGLVQRDLSREILERKLAALTAANPDGVVTGNPGCAMQIGAGLRAAGRPTPVYHPVELLDRSYARAGRYDGETVDSRGL